VDDKTRTILESREERRIISCRAARCGRDFKKWPIERQTGESARKTGGGLRLPSISLTDDQGGGSEGTKKKEGLG